MVTAAKKAATKAPAKKATPAPKPTTNTGQPRVIKAGGAKGAAVVAAITANPDATRAEIATQAGCTTGRVGEVIRFLATDGTEAERKLCSAFLEKQRRAPRAAKPAADKPAKKAAAKKASPPRKAAAKKATVAPSKQDDWDQF